MRTKSIFTALLAGAVAFTSCSKDDVNEGGGVDNGATSQVFIKVEKADTDTRSIGSPVADGTDVTFGTGHIFFTSGAGTITRHVKIVTTVVTPADEVSLALIQTTGVTIDNVLSSTKDCYIVMKPTAAVATAIAGITATTNISAIKAAEVTVSEFGGDTDGGVDKVTLWGEVKNMTLETDGTFAPTVPMGPIGSRLQVKSFQSKPWTDTSDGKVYAITNYEVDGVYVNNYYNKMKVDGSLVATDRISHGSVHADYGLTNYPATLFLSDLHAAWSANEVVAAGKTTIMDGVTPKAWVYNILPTETITGTDAQKKEHVPHIVIRFKNVKYSVDGNPELTVAADQYITVKGLIDVGTSQDVVSILKRHMYTIDEIPVTFDNLKDVPEESYTKALVKVTALKWKDVPVNPEI